MVHSLYKPLAACPESKFSLPLLPWPLAGTNRSASVNFGRFWDQVLLKSMKKTLSEEGDKSEVNLKTNGGLGCSQEQEDSVVVFEKDLNDVKIA